MYKAGMLIAGWLFTVVASAEDLAFPNSQAEIEQIFNQGRFVGGGVALDESDWEDEPKVEIKVGASIEFAVNSAEILPDSLSLLDEYGKAFTQGLADYTFLVVGHTDSQGDEGYNLSLSMQRAQAVVDYLVENYGIDTLRLRVRGKGEDEPIASNDTEAGRARNRRVEFIKTW